MMFVPRRAGVVLPFASARPGSRGSGRRPSATRRHPLAGAVLPAVLLAPLLVGCGASDAPDGTRAAPVPSRTAVDDTSGRVPAVAGATDLSRKPISAAGRGTAPATLVTTDLVTGHGALASATSTVTVRYVGVLWRDGKEFDSSWAGGQPATFPLDGTIAGFGQGIDGMRVGGRRQIIIPPDLGYGPVGGRPPTILADDTLVFVVDLIAVDGATSGVGATPGVGAGAGQP
ncbi:peptidylprolyl isomerase [Frankia sp. CcI156]|uniref:FKBP-type peptidyl-prolyl cis-trans isomerase n=1 Tax=Frankia TaxID=1854 RepID=UPI000409A893|nr:MULTISPECIES: FKBP-type peptidyl-prolyl cis-trans isomerase [Frankia]OHV53772.1 peptidylprolyl isomerase [Frankia sp. CgIS1]ONH25429.1 peptidylprolyl isomerase [Frankia sp. CcI156]